MRNVIFVEDEIISSETQMALFAVGFRWSRLINGVQYTKKPFLYTEPKGMWITHGDDFVYASNMVLKEGAVPLNGHNVIKNPMVVCGAESTGKTIKIKGKEYSESTILNALRAYVGE